MSETEKLDMLTGWAGVWNIEGLLDKTSQELLELQSLRLEDDECSIPVPGRYDGMVDYIPDEIDVLQNLEHLSIDLKFVSKLPDTICNLSNLKSLTIDWYSSIRDLPIEIYRLENLEKVTLQTDKIDKIPSALFTLSNLKILSLNGTKIGVLPKEIANLTQLNTLIITNNNLKSLPD